MKLYTKEQVKQIVEKSRETGLTAEYLMLVNTPITLPSDEEIRSEADSFYGLESYNQTFIRGAKWMQDKLTNSKEK